MIYITPCKKCKNWIGMVDGWLPACKAFPEGMPYDFEDEKIPEMAECNNGYKYEPNENEE